MTPAARKPGTYSTKEVAKLLGLPEARVRSFVSAGFLQPEREGRGGLLFSFQDIVLLRTAKGLLDARVPARRVKQSLRKLKAQLPSGRSLTGVSISADGTRVVVRDGSSRWVPETGQILFDFEVRPIAEKIAPLAARAASAAKRRESELSADEWFDLGCELELNAPQEARDAYRRAVELDPHFADAHTNLGRLLHEVGEVAAATAHYRLALAAAPDSETAHFNLGVALEDDGHFEDAAAAYTRVLALDAGYADAHFNLARLYERMGRHTAALRHLKAYKALS
jgi:Tfp pilus assembly protein PilF